MSSFDDKIKQKVIKRLLNNKKNPRRWGGDKKGRESGIGKGEPMLIKLCAIDENLALSWENARGYGELTAYCVAKR